MKLILSRKGFDSTAGGTASPIFPDGRMVSLPIPDNRSTIRYGDIHCQGEPLGSLVTQLTRGKIHADHRAHLDPDLMETSLARLPGWRPLFGQAGAAQSHLRNQGVGAGDVFLFFGLFRPVRRREDGWAWVPNAPSRHVIWGWMQIAEVLPLDGGAPKGYAWAQYHPHFQWESGANNVVYVASPTLTLHGEDAGLPGAGTFKRFCPRLQLTSPAARGTTPWLLPDWFYPVPGRTPLSYHGKAERWERQGGTTRLDVVKRGQEFVLHIDDYPEAIPWLRNLGQWDYKNLVKRKGRLERLK
ncbi:hypothetical protein J2T57_004228 [Natronocella acetinitrilica]|uniref:Nucleotide modification associated domain-containing protein n=1 Tax=Natronocella acetinitrilica TaxID=414046 RepID=A0AAE3G8N8_9GAMM|nr:hypothetical protein [Natronocella acetinitrilica]MCP1677054.1 hypothetical protein [Natronocella acetinitrilica]